VESGGRAGAVRGVRVAVAHRMPRLTTWFRVFVPAVVLALGVPSLAFPQTHTPAPPSEPSLRTFFQDLAGDVRRLPSSAGALSVAAGGILSTSLSPLDDDLQLWDATGAFEAGTLAGNSLVLGAGTLAVYGVGRWLDQRRVSHVAIDVLRAQVLSLGIAYGLKYTVRRERPDHSSSDSFPSGHSAQTFASATVLTRHLGPAAAVPAFGAAGFVAMSRVNQRRHYLTDVMFGAGLGVAVGWTGTRRVGAWQVTPAVSPSGAAVSVSRRMAP
jgi:membrane-associated phospholipid phosphatase